MISSTYSDIQKAYEGEMYVDLWPKSSKIDSRLVYSSQLYGSSRIEVWTLDWDNVNSLSEIISTQCASLRPLVQVKEFDINFDDH